MTYEEVVKEAQKIVAKDLFTGRFKVPGLTGIFTEDYRQRGK